MRGGITSSGRRRVRFKNLKSHTTHTTQLRHTRLKPTQPTHAHTPPQRGNGASATEHAHNYTRKSYSYWLITTS